VTAVNVVAVRALATTAVKKAADDLVAQRFLLPDDAIRLAAEAERDEVRSAP
jgi:hypothetical protein